mmetsp:Transcript_122949/g.344141  ORF Transcript_122949/g.344141 Transcript_122949/m.344141 type:complete len:201 (+) Transcript_122949:144-746(+)
MGWGALGPQRQGLRQRQRGRDACLDDHVVPLGRAWVDPLHHHGGGPGHHEPPPRLPNDDPLHLLAADRGAVLRMGRRRGGHLVHHDDDLRRLHLLGLGSDAGEPGDAALGPRLLPRQGLQRPGRPEVRDAHLRGHGQDVLGGHGELRHPDERGYADRHHRGDHIGGDVVRDLWHGPRHRELVEVQLLLGHGLAPLRALLG